MHAHSFCAFAQNNRDICAGFLPSTAARSLLPYPWHRGVAHLGEYVDLIREPRNPYDRNAIRVDNLSSQQVGTRFRDQKRCVIQTLAGSRCSADAFGKSSTRGESALGRSRGLSAEAVLFARVAVFVAIIFPSLRFPFSVLSAGRLVARSQISYKYSLSPPAPLILRPHRKAFPRPPRCHVDVFDPQF